VSVKFIVRYNEKNVTKFLKNSQIFKTALEEIEDARLEAGNMKISLNINFHQISIGSHEISSRLRSDYYQTQMHLIEKTVNTRHYVKYENSYEKVIANLEELEKLLEQSTAFIVSKYPDVLILQQSLSYIEKRYNLTDDSNKMETVSSQAQRNLKIIEVKLQDFSIESSKLTLMNFI
jgi:hypothetical protein